MKIRLPEKIASPQDLNVIISEIKEYSKWYSHEEIKKKLNAKSGSESKAPIISEEARSVIKEWTTTHPISSTSVDSLIDELRKYSEHASTISITLAAPATEDIRRKLIGWCRDNIAPDVFVNFSFNSTILGGIVVHYGSRIFDWSFRRQILAERLKFPEVLRRV
jgi:hypothetical protein